MMILQFENGSSYRLKELETLSDSRLAYGLAQENTPLGRAFVDSIWYNRPIRLYDPGKGMIADGKVWKCHITGPLFAQLLAKAKAKDAENDYSAVWELEITEWKPADALRGQTPEELAKDPEVNPIPEYHLDHPYYVKAQ